MLLKARDDLGLEMLAISVLIGDKDSDIEAGRAAGVGYLARLTHGAQSPICAATEDTRVFSDLRMAMNWLCSTFQ